MGGGIRDVWVTNSASHKKEKLETRETGKLTMYSCGPTVYGLIHIGNLRAAMVSDLFFRYFQSIGYQVQYVRNYTDVDDKIIKRAEEEGISTSEVTKKYIQEVEKDYAVAGLLQPTHKTLATEHMAEIIEMIEKIIEKGHAYVEAGEVLFSIESFEGYGKLSGKELDDLIAGVRIEVDQKKRNPLDFSLWKPAKEGEPSWDSPWGKGRPGWHIECSAMSRKWLGDQIDVHHGGMDLVFPHHENEIAQSESCSGRAPFVRYWLHNGFVTMSKQKMAKSVGNIFVARDFLTQYGGEVARFLLLSVHYRSPLDYGDEALEKALKSLERLYEAKKKALALTRVPAGMPDTMAENAWGEFVAGCEKHRRAIADAFANDFNTAGALGEFFTIVRDFNKTLSFPKAEGTPAVMLAAAQLIEVIEKEIGTVMGIGQQSPDHILAKIREIRSQGQANRPSEAEIEALIQERIDARTAKDYARSDEIRDQLLAKGVEIQDGSGGTTWKFR